MKVAIVKKREIALQPNKVTMSITQGYTKTQHNIFILLIDAIQQYMTRDERIQTDLFRRPIIPINIHRIADKRNKSKIVREIIGMCKKGVCFDYKDLNAQERDVYAPLFVTVENLRNTKFVEVTVNDAIIPALIYWGKGVGGTFFKVETALALSKYPKAFYQLCRMWRVKKERKISIVHLRKWLDIENKYPRLTDIEKRILKPSRSILKDSSDVDVYFDYEFLASDQNDENNITHIKLTIHSKNKNEHSKEDFQKWYSRVYGFLLKAYDGKYALDYTDQLSEYPANLKLAYNKFIKINTDSESHLMNSVRKIMREDFM